MFVHYMSLCTMSKQVNVLQNVFTVLIELLVFTLVYPALIKKRQRLSLIQFQRVFRITFLSWRKIYSA